MIKENQIYNIDKVKADELEVILNGTYLEDFEVIYHLTFPFGNEIEADIDVCNGESNKLSKPYVFIQWF